VAKTVSGKPRVLVVDDGTTYTEVISSRMPEVILVDPGDLGESGRLADGPAALQFLARHRSKVDVVLLDMHFDIPEENLFALDETASLRKTRRFQGVAIHREIRAKYPELPVVLLTSVQDLAPVEAAGELAAQSMTYFMDGEDLDALRIRINAAFQEAGQEKEGARVLWGEDTAMRAVRRRLAMLARGRMPVILEGETGTGKSFLAEHAIHKESGRPGPFVVCDLATLPIDLIPAHLFGALRGAYTGSVSDRKGLFEMAHKGTLFIDEVQNIPLQVQKQLLQALQEHRIRPLGSAREVDVDVKVIAASNQALDQAVASGQFRSDLYMRLSPARRVRIPPIRERLPDLKFLAGRFVERAVRDPDVEDLMAQLTEAVGLGRHASMSLVIGRPAASKTEGALELILPEPAWQMLAAHKWPGNTRELENVIQNIVTFTLIGAVDAIRDGLTIRTSRLQVDPGLIGELLAGSAILSENPEERDAPDADTPGTICIEVKSGATLNAVSSDVERQYFLALYQRFGGDFDEMAAFLLGDSGKGRAIRLRFNQLGLKVREISLK
jgi:DNA-binding NtrC family response regulator